MNKETRNSFQKGLNTDVSPAWLEPFFYTDAHNLELVGDGHFYALKNVRGTLDVQTITASTDVELETYESTYKIGSTYGVKCLTIFTFGSGTLKIWCYDTQNDVLYQLYQGAPENAGSYLTSDRIIDARGYAENGIDLIYFTDFWSEVRQLRCEIPSPYVANFLTDFDLSLTRRGANGIISLAGDCVLTGGSLLSGTYQFAYRMVNPSTKKLTKWSSLTNPIHVYLADTTISAYTSKAGIGLYTDKKIRLDVLPSQAELDDFDYLQLAVVENIFPTTPTTASLLQITLSGNGNNYEYTSNQKIGTIPIEDIVVDLAPIKKAKTLAIANNKLLLGNLEYQQLELDNGTPIVTTGSTIVVETSAASTVYWNGVSSTTRKGYFRGEVYRFGVVFFDKFGNKSQPYPLDMSSVVGNTISSALDFKFPERSDSTSYTILDGSDSPRVLGLSLVIDNSPTWAVGFEIVRVKRKKRILFQSPVVPFMRVKGVGALYEYPTTQSNGAFNQNYEYPDAQPMTSGEVYIPKNLAWPELRNIVASTPNTLTTSNRIMDGEVKLEVGDNYTIAGLFPPSNMYGETAYNYFGGEKLETIDYVLLATSNYNHSLTVTNTSGSANVIGNEADTSMSYTFHGMLDNQYYHSSTLLGIPITAANGDRYAVDYNFFDNLSSGGVVGGQRVFQYDELTTKGVSFGATQPSVNRMAVVQLSSPFQDEMQPSLTFAAGVKNAYAGGAIIVGATGPSFESSLTNNLVNTYTDYSFSLAQCVRIVNVVNDNVGDTRYGDINTEYEFISTGAVYSFDTSELALVAAGGSNQFTIAVWGGDCFISSHTFKVSDSTYAVTNQVKNTGTAETNTVVADNWGGKIYRTLPFGTDSVYCIPVALKNNAQFIQVFLESEYNGEVLDNTELNKVTTISDAVVWGATASEAQCRTPLSYSYNINLNKENDQKIYFSKPQFTFDQDIFPSRIIISDQKVYNSSEQGFDVFRVLNVTDLEESNGSITKLAMGGDDVYAIQERAIVYLPTGQTQLEQTDAGILSVGTGSDIGRTITIDSNRGGQNLAAIAESGNVIYVPDVRNKAVYQLAGQQIKIISSINNDTLFRSLFTTGIQDRGLRSLYDPLRKEYWLFRNETTPSCYVFNESLDMWVGNYEFNTTGKLYNGVFTNGSLFTVGVNSDIVVSKMYQGNYNVLLGQTVTPRATVIVNPDGDFSKTFDNLMFVATDRLATVDAVVERESSLGNQTVSGMIVDASSRGEGNYRIKVLRGSGSARLRGLRMKATVKWLTTNVTSALSAIYTRYRTSPRTNF